MKRMFLRVFLFFLCLHPVFLVGDIGDQSAQYSTGPIPSWVKPYDFPLDTIPLKPSQVNLQYLLIDTQQNLEEKTFYRHVALRTLTQSGIEDISQLQIEFNPSYSQIVMHEICVFRDGKWSDRLGSARYKLIQREPELEKNLYNGNLTLIYFLDDIREGDIIEYSFSFKGDRPFFSSHYTDRIYMQREFPVERIIHRLLGPQDLSFVTKPINTAIEPKICDLSSSLREWIWEAEDTAPHLYETNQPSWYDPPAHIQVSQYQTWAEVAQKCYPLYVLPPDLTKSIPSEMQALVEKWKISTSEPSERALLALRFVQDQIRYLGIEEGMGAFQPTEPGLIFQRRFGDCKDKGFLLHALLQLLDIPSRPVLVHMSRGKRLPETLPSPFVFDHLVLQLEIDGMNYYVDPTISLQGGSLQTNFFPEYAWGLLISNDSEGLVQLPKISYQSLIEIDSSVTLESEDIAHLKVKKVFHGSKASRLRRLLAWKGLKKTGEEFLSTLQEFYGAVAVEAPIKVTDDRENNIVTIVESYRLPTQAFSDKKTMKIFSYTLRGYLDRWVNPERASPYQLYYPLWVKEHIHIDNSFGCWDKVQEDYQVEHEALSYAISTRIEEKKATYELELKHLQDHIPKEALRDYWKAINEIEDKSPPKLTIVSSL